MKALFIIAPQDFKDDEFFEPYRILEQAQLEISVASKGVAIAKGSGGGVQPVDLDISDVNVEDFDAIIFVGGPGAKIYFESDEAHFVAQNALAKNKVIGAICIAPSILANAGILSGKKATSFSSELKNLEVKGALVQKDQNVVVDGKIVTASGPSFAKEFGETVLKISKP